MFQYISCYSYLRLPNGLQYCIRSFNTSHVTLYLAAPLATIKYCLVSIHLMLLFISNGGHTRNLPHQFQYISCYSLSDFEGLGQSVQSTFQYISCYSLSPLVRSWEMQPRSFQYISCYSLSNCAAISPGCLIVSIHLMLLFIVAYQTCKRLRHGVSIHLMLLFI